MGQIKVSKDQDRLAYTIPLTPGADVFCGVLRDVISGTVLHNGLIPGIVSLEWTADAQSVLYTVPDDSGRPHKVGGAAGPSLG